MTISSISPNVNHATAVSPQKQPASAKEVENDKDKDDAGSTAAAQSTPRPSVNTSGQVVGSKINTQA